MAHFLRYDGRWYRLVDSEVDAVRGALLANSAAGEHCTFTLGDQDGNPSELYYTPGVAVTITQTRNNALPSD